MDEWKDAELERMDEWEKSVDYMKVDCMDSIKEINGHEWMNMDG